MNKRIYIGLLVFLHCFLCQCQQDTTQQKLKNPTVYNKLTEQEKYVILNKGTDRPFTGNYYNKKDKGKYVCRQCNNPLYNSDDKFDSHCGWPSFDDEIEGSVIRQTDLDGRRTEIICSNCKGHLGHVFLNEGFTDKQTRHCVNTSSIVFYPIEKLSEIPKVIK
jgi:peptide-methionine (R)-S-oxide reductase